MDSSLTISISIGLGWYLLLFFMIPRTDMIEKSMTMEVIAFLLVLLNLNIYNVSTFFINCVKGNFFSFYIESRWMKK